MNSRLRVPAPESTAQLIDNFASRARKEDPQASLFSPAELSPRLWTIEEVAEFLQMSKDWMRDHATRRQPRIPCIRLGGRRAVLRFRPQDVKQFVNDNFQSGEHK